MVYLCQANDDLLQQYQNHHNASHLLWPTKKTQTKSTSPCTIPSYIPSPSFQTPPPTTSQIQTPHPCTHTNEAPATRTLVTHVRFCIFLKNSSIFNNNLTSHHCQTTTPPPPNIKHQITNHVDDRDADATATFPAVRICEDMTDIRWYACMQM